MYLAHKCPKCSDGDVVFDFTTPKHKCDICEYVEDTDVFNYIENQETCIRKLENQLADMFPFRELSLVGSSINLAVGNHVTGKFDSRDFCMNSAIERAKAICDKWQVCYIGFCNIENAIKRYESIDAKYTEGSKYTENVKSVREFFKDFPDKIKAVCK